MGEGVLQKIKGKNDKNEIHRQILEGKTVNQGLIKEPIERGGLDSKNSGVKK